MSKKYAVGIVIEAGSEEQAFDYVAETLAPGARSSAEFGRTHFVGGPREIADAAEYDSGDVAKAIDAPDSIAAATMAERAELERIEAEPELSPGEVTRERIATECGYDPDGEAA
jgi:hypothetical protein